MQLLENPQLLLSIVGYFKLHSLARLFHGVTERSVFLVGTICLLNRLWHPPCDPTSDMIGNKVRPAN